MKKVLVFGFQKYSPECIVIESSLKGAEEILKIIQNQKPDYVIGMGRYTGRDNSQIRIETQCTNKFRNKIDGDKLETLNLDIFFDCSQFKVGTRMGNSWCNLVSFKILKMRGELGLNFKYSFLHVPKGNFNV